MRCQNGASCIDQLASVICVCKKGYAGQFCELFIDYCDSYPCGGPGATCDSSYPGMFRCNCPDWRHGEFCEFLVDSCESGPCSLNSVCVTGFYGQDEGTDYTCICSKGKTGRNCQTSIDFCGSSPCENDGTCTGLFFEMSEGRLGRGIVKLSRNNDNLSPFSVKSVVKS